MCSSGSIVREFLPGKKGKLIAPATPGTPATPGLTNLGVFAGSQQMSQVTQLTEQISEQMRQRMMPVFAESMKGFHTSSGIMRQLYGTPGTPGTPARYAPDGPPENSVEQLLRFRWIEADAEEGLALTPLGRALLRADLLESTGGSDTDILVLNADDPLAWGKLLGRIGEQDECYIVDPYLKAPELAQIIKYTSTARVLVGPYLKKAELTELLVLLATPGHEHIEVRQAPRQTIHDRYIIGETEMHLIGASMNNIGGTTTTILVPIPESAALALREQAKTWWEMSKLLAPAEPSTRTEGDDE